MTAAPFIYAPHPKAIGITVSNRLIALLLAIVCITILGVGQQLSPSHDGIGTHTELGLGACEFLARTHLPCPSCGMTTSVTLFAHGNLLASLWVQPMGMVIAAILAIAFWPLMYVALTGKSVKRLLPVDSASYYLLALMFFAIAAWGWKMWIHARGMDGW